MLKIKLLNKNSSAPSRAHAEDAGLDIYHIGEKLIIKAGEKVKIPTGFAMSVPLGSVAKIYPRSGLATTKGLVLANTVGIIDSSYRGEVFITMKNNSDKLFTLNKGDRFAQMVLQPCWLWQPQIVAELDSTERGDKGLGGTGK